MTTLHQRLAAHRAAADGAARLDSFLAKYLTVGCDCAAGAMRQRGWAGESNTRPAPAAEVRGSPAQPAPLPPKLYPGGPSACEVMGLAADLDCPE